jgi:Xaa-Pro aminopeptidase
MASRNLLRLPAFALVIVLVACGGRTPTAPSDDTTSFDPRYSLASFREAGRITAAAGNEVLRTLRAGQFERDVKSVIDGVFSHEGSGAPAFPHIVASGPNALELHYEGDSRQIGDGEMLLIDIGATSSAHCSDMSRTYPASGRFSARQLELYQLVLQGQQQAAANVRVGVVTLSGLTQVVRDFYRASPLRARDASGVDATLDRFLTHSVSHFVGREVHGGDTGWSTNSPIQVNQVFTIEPGVYIASESIGIRIEDTYVVTTRGMECLTCAATKDAGSVQRVR